ncbi:MAG: hypothetical protein JWR61_610 [Ferruginibacter sp.]|uniref:hypothetical protein n=1 Tax=Ferruginibacter sp. TaxID=1940288 RepID=UPI0026584BED|nr:hypothetical protein [Ferruginibacter sp.]MDB5275655.1 hypothetical protein [Ferruginibacter sp.]
MKNIYLLLVSFLLLTGVKGQQGSNTSLLSKTDMNYLEGLTRDVMESSRIYPGQKISDDFGNNNTGIVLIRPGGRSSYPAYWIRDYVMSLESGFVTAEEQKQLLLLTAKTQCDQTWISNTGSMIPVGAIADHIRIDDSKPIFFPGTYDYREQGGKIWGMTPPYCDQYFFIHMAHYYVTTAAAPKFLFQQINDIPLIDRLEMAYKVPPTRQDSALVYTTDDFRGVDFGFRDVITMTGDLCLPSLLKYRASLEMADLFELIHLKDKAKSYRNIAAKLKQTIPQIFYDSRGMLVASTGKSRQADVWSTALAVYFGVLEDDRLIKTSQLLRKAYKNGTLSFRGNIRHILTTDDYNDSTAWEHSLAEKNTYQNGAYWGTPTGWVCYAIAKTDIAAAKQLAKEYMDDLRAGDYRKGPQFGAPWECYNKNTPQNSVYLASVSGPYIAFKRQSSEGIKTSSKAVKKTKKNNQ